VKENPETEKLAYMLASVNVVKPDEMGPYMQKCGPMFAAAGIEVIALGVTGSSLQLLEGEWPYEGSLMLYKCGSMDSLLQFWNSSEYQEAMKLREGIVETNFTVAIETTA
jgi:uncharacterized protein (DUF1330 family)